MPPRDDYNHAARKRTATLPQKLRTELEQLGHLPPNSNNPRKSRKERRKDKRTRPKLNRKLAHEGPAAVSRKRPADDDHGPSTSTAPSSSRNPQPPAPPAKRTKVAHPPRDADPADAPQQPKTTALERRLAKQERGTGPDPRARNKDPAATDEDREIAWLEAKLGLQQKALTSAEKGRMRSEFDDDGLGELFDGLGDLEGAAFGTGKKNYAKLLKSGDLDLDELDLPSDFDPADLDLSDLEGGDDDNNDDDSSVDEALTEYGIDEDELVNPSDDDDHGEMGELGSEDEGDEALFDDGEDEEFAGISSAEDDEEEDEMEEEAPAPRSRTVRFADDDGESASASSAPAVAAVAPAPAPASTSGRYVPPHLRKAAAAAAAAESAPPSASATDSGARTPSSAPSSDAPPALAPIPDDPRLRRQLQGHLNKLSSANLGAIVDALQALYRANPRAVVSNTLTQLLLGTLADRDHLGEALVVTYAALCAALFRVIGIEFPAGIVTEAVRMLDGALDKHSAAAAATGPAASTSAAGADGDDFEGRPGGKEALNLASFVAELYNLQVVHCGLVYDLVRDLVGRGAAGEGMGELEVELLSRIVKRSGQQLRSDDPSALKDIVSLVKHKMAGVDPSSMNSRTRFMVEQLTNLKNNKFKATAAGASSGADGAVDHRTPVRKYLSSLNRSRASGAAPDPLRVGLGELRDPKRGKWWLVGAAWAGDPLAEHQAGLEQQGSLGGGGKGGKEATGDAELARLARSQGMNTDVRKGVFNVLMSSEDYIDACERLQQLGLSDVQQREIARVLLQCCGNEKVYNPYYTLVASRLCAKSHSFQITLQYILWDFIRSDLGEQSVGGQELVKNLGDQAAPSDDNKVPPRKMTHTAKFYAWCIAKGALSLAVLKPIPFATPLPATRTFLVQLMSHVILATQTPSPAFALPTAATKKDRAALERVVVLCAPHPRLQRGLALFLDPEGGAGATLAGQWIGKKVGEKEKAVVKWGMRVALETLSVGGIVPGDV
ncbi:hypothetical protein JCM9279_006398 [Rhodotorula babjevae]